MHTFVATFIIAVGIALLAYMIVIEDEPGAIPLLLIIAGSVWLVTHRYRSRMK